MAARKIVVAHLYPAEMNIYGDRGNVITLVKRLNWRGYQVEVDEIEVGDNYDFRKADIIFGGGGQDRGQSLIAEDLKAREANLKIALEDGVVGLTICGTYQLFGRGFETKDGLLIAGIEVFKAQTVGSGVRMIGNIVIDTPFGQLVGFENHSGQTTLDSWQEPLGRVVKGYGNNDHDHHEGAVYKNVFGTYLHGPVLPKNPTFADELIRRALARKGDSFELTKLNDSLELAAAQTAKSRP